MKFIRSLFSRWPQGLLATGLILLAQAGTAEQKVHLGPFDVHYMVAPSTFFNEQIAERYQIKRGRDRALLNLSILNDSQTPVAAAVEGDVTNLLGQITTLEFREVREGGAIYYLAALKFADRETLRFRISMTMADGVSRELKFQQQMFWDGP